MSNALLEVAGVHTHIGAYHILHGVDLSVPEGEVTMLLGRNGAGKTTTLRTVMGLWAGLAGQHPLQGPSHRRPADARYRVVGHCLRAREHGHLHRPDGAGKHGAGGPQRAQRTRAGPRAAGWIFGLFPALKKFWLYPAGKLSGGQKQMLAVARAICEPRALILIDEPSKGLAPSIIQNLIGAFRELKAQKTTILLVEQNFMMAKALGDQVAVMDNGRVVHSGAMAELAADESLQQRLLGLVAGSTPMSTTTALAPRLRPFPRPFDWKPVALLATVMLVALPAVGSGSTWLTLTVAGLAMGLIIFIIASGLTLIFGLMDVLNFGHGVFIALGAFVATSVMGGLAVFADTGLLQALLAIFCAMWRRWRWPVRWAGPSSV
jgi:branched-chain amino acid transport system ATP-binding protein